jgi:hypothetical protein
MGWYYGPWCNKDKKRKRVCQITMLLLVFRSLVKKSGQVTVVYRGNNHAVKKFLKKF